MKTLTLLITHGMGDWYLPLSCLDYWKNQFLCDTVYILVDSIYFTGQQKYSNETKTAIELLNSLPYVWNYIDPKYFGSGDYVGIKDRHTGPVYDDIKSDFLFYRSDCLKELIKKEVLPNTDIFISGCNKHSYLWKDNTNIPLTFDYRKPINIKNNTSLVYNKDQLVIHVRTRGNNRLLEAYQTIINKCNEYNIETCLLGLKSEGELNRYTTDFRETLNLKDTFDIIENSKWFVGNNSMYTMHRMMFNKPTISFIAESNGKKESFFTDRELNNPVYNIINSDNLIIDQILNILGKWYQYDRMVK